MSPCEPTCREPSGENLRHFLKKSQGQGQTHNLRQNGHPHTTTCTTRAQAVAPGKKAAEYNCLSRADMRYCTLGRFRRVFVLCSPARTPPTLAALLPPSSWSFELLPPSSWSPPSRLSSPRRRWRALLGCGAASVAASAIMEARGTEHTDTSSARPASGQAAPRGRRAEERRFIVKRARWRCSTNLYIRRMRSEEVKIVCIS